MKNVLIFAGIAGIAAAVAIYLTSRSEDTATGYVTDADIEAYNSMENSGDPYPVP